MIKKKDILEFLKTADKRRCKCEVRSCRSKVDYDLAITDVVEWVNSQPDNKPQLKAVK